MKAGPRGQRDLRIVLEYLLGFSSRDIAARYGVKPRTVTDKIKRFRDGDLPVPPGASAERLRQLAEAHEKALPKMSAAGDPLTHGFGDIDLPMHILALQLDAVRELGLGDLIGADTIGMEELGELRETLTGVLLRHGAPRGLRNDIVEELASWFERYKAPWVHRRA